MFYIDRMTLPPADPRLRLKARHLHRIHRAGIENVDLTREHLDTGGQSLEPLRRPHLVKRRAQLQQFFGEIGHVLMAGSEARLAGPGGRAA